MGRKQRQWHRSRLLSKTSIVDWLVKLPEGEKGCAELLGNPSCSLAVFLSEKPFNRIHYSGGTPDGIAMIQHPEAVHCLNYLKSRRRLLLLAEVILTRWPEKLRQKGGFVFATLPTLQGSRMTLAGKAACGLFCLE